MFWVCIAERCRDWFAIFLGWFYASPITTRDTKEWFHFPASFFSLLLLLFLNFFKENKIPNLATVGLATA